mmetsp:Transcript_11646/g.19369  ORF Transcript_11646/g.19369 Transcript_11646/m.19369 type:complete len:383 (-) Transcript_11646:837-1985(-)
MVVLLRGVRMHRLISLSLLCATTMYQVEAFVSPQRRLPVRKNPLMVQATASSNLRADYFEPQMLHQEQQLVASTDGRMLQHHTTGPPLRKRFPALLLLLASLSTRKLMGSTTTNFGKSNPFISSIFVTTQVPRFIVSPLSLAAGSIGLILCQGCGLQFLTVASILMKQLGTIYMTNLSAFPCITKSITSGVIGFGGDFMAQRLEYRLENKKRQKQTYDLRRGLGIMAGGFFISGPLMHLGYNLFERILPTHGGASSQTLAALTHVVADSLFLDSIFVATACIVTGIVEGYGFRKHIIPQFRRDYVPTLKAGWATSLTLMPLEFVCFRFLPETLRALAMNLTDVIWDGTVSFMTHRNRNKDDRTETTAKHMLALRKGKVLQEF